MGDEAPARRASSTRWAGRCPRDAFGGSFCTRWSRTWSRSGLVVGLDYQRRDASTCTRCCSAEAAPALPPVPRGRRDGRVGRQDDPRGRLLRAARAPARRRRCWSRATPPASSTWRRSRASTTRCSRACCAARAIFAALKTGDTSAAALAAYDRAVDDELHRAGPARSAGTCASLQVRLLPGRRSRPALMTLTGGAFPGGRIDGRARTPRSRARLAPARAVHARRQADLQQGGRGLQGRATPTRDDIPSHLVVGQDVPPEVAELYQHMCPAGVYERAGRQAGRERAQLRRLQGHRRARARAGRRARAAAARATAGCDREDARRSSSTACARSRRPTSRVDSRRALHRRDARSIPARWRRYLFFEPTHYTRNLIYQVRPLRADGHLLGGGPGLAHPQPPGPELLDDRARGAPGRPELRGGAHRPRARLLRAARGPPALHGRRAPVARGARSCPCTRCSTCPNTRSAR